MKLFRHGPKNSEKPGLVDAGGGLRDLSGVVDDIAGATLLPASLARLAALDPSTLPLLPDGTRLGPCVGRVGKVIGIGLNFADHAAETGAPLPRDPVVFLKATSALAGPDDPLPLMSQHTKIDWEVELAAVIGKPAFHVADSQALRHVAGYAVANDISDRFLQKSLDGGQWALGKSCDGFCPLGPWLVTADTIPDPQALSLWQDVNDTRQQSGLTERMIFSVAQLISYLSRFMTLESGDVILTGTPPGVGAGQKPPKFLNPGDKLRLGIQGPNQDLGEQHILCVSGP